MRSVSRTMRSRNANMIDARRIGGVSDQAAKAARAVCTAPSTSAALANETRRLSSPVGGLEHVTGPARRPLDGSPSDEVTKRGERERLHEGCFVRGGDSSSTAGSAAARTGGAVPP